MQRCHEELSARSKGARLSPLDKTLEKKGEKYEKNRKSPNLAAKTRDNLPPYRAIPFEIVSQWGYRTPFAF